MDDLDRKLLGLLQQDSQQKYADLADQLNLSAPAVHERVKKLKKAGVIKHYTVELDGEALGFPLTSFISVFLKGASCVDVMPALEAFPEIEECHSLAGEACLLLKVRTATPKELEALLVALWAVPGIESTTTNLALDSYLRRGTRVA
ncbi:Lrp/AsnC family transcriptional regulator [Rhodovibrionaceae bacterium A322]